MQEAGLMHKPKLIQIYGVTMAAMIWCEKVLFRGSLICRNHAATWRLYMTFNLWSIYYIMSCSYSVGIVSLIRCIVANEHKVWKSVFVWYRIKSLYLHLAWIEFIIHGRKNTVHWMHLKYGYFCIVVYIGKPYWYAYRYILTPRHCLRTGVTVVLH